MRVRRSLWILLLTCLIGLVALPGSPVAAAKCSAIGPGANLSGCDLSGLDLSGVNLSGANLRGANLEGTNLDGANLAGANLNNARVTEGALDNANTSGANLRGIHWVPVPAPDPVVSVSISFSGVEHGVTYCFVHVELSHFGPNTTYSVLFYVDGIHRPHLTRDVTTDDAGYVFSGLFSGTRNNLLMVAEVSGVQSAAVPITC
jgi:hypothetical protein